jgi:uncharacterized protein (TIGR03437 family)
MLRTSAFPTILLASLSATACLAADAPAFTSPGALTSFINQPANLGIVFTAQANVSVTALGIFNDPKLTSPETVGLYNNSGSLLASVTVPLSSPNTNGYLFAAITPVPLKAGSQYTVASFVGSNSWDYGAVPITDQRIKLDSSTYNFASSLTFPATAAPSGQIYYGPNFLIGAPAGTANIQVPGYTISVVSPGIFYPTGMSLDASGNLYVACQECSGEFNFYAGVYKVTLTGKVSAFAGGAASSPFLGDGGPATNAVLSSPSGVAVDSFGNVYIADSGDNRIRKVDTTGTISTVAGPGSGPLGDGGAATSATLSNPTDVAVDSAGNILIADKGNKRIRRVSPDGTITTIAGGGTAAIGTGVTATSATLSGPTALALDSAGDVYFTDTSFVREVSVAGIVTTVAGTNTLNVNQSATSFGDGGPVGSSGFGSLTGIAVDASNNIYVGDSGSVRIISPGGIINKIAGGGSGSFASTAPATEVAVNPVRLTLGNNGSIYGSDSRYQSGAVWLLTPSPTPVFPLPSAVKVNSASGFPPAESTVPLGGWIEIYGSYLAFDSRTWSGPDFNGINAPTSLDSTSVTIGGQPAYIGYISPSQINAQVPSNIGTGEQPLVITTANGPSATYAVTIKSAQPGILTTPAFLIKGIQYAVALFSDGATYVLPTGAIAGVPSRPAKVGDIITLYGIGFGTTNPDNPAGQIVQAGNSLTLPVTVTVGSQKAALPYAGLTPGVIGLYQFNVVVPTIPVNTSTAAITFNQGAAGSVSLSLAVQ